MESTSTFRILSSIQLAHMSNRNYHSQSEVRGEVFSDFGCHLHEQVKLQAKLSASGWTKLIELATPQLCHPDRVPARGSATLSADAPATPAQHKNEPLAYSVPDTSF